MHRFRFDAASVKEGVVQLDREESHHALAVLRLKRGDVVELFDGAGNKFSGVLLGDKKGCVSVALNRAIAAASRTASIVLAISVIKPDRMEWLIEKACELGVSAIQPLLSERSVVRISRERWDAKIARWKKIAAESCKQCGRGVVPEIFELRDYAVFTKNLKKEYDLILIPTLAAAGSSFKKALGVLQPKKALVFIGPEGDFTPNEVEAARAQGAVPVSLGELVMRSETAAIYALSALNFYLSD